ncbi:MAG TPA: hypothetical protein VHJ16_16870 [Xanthobacteraceae bacterium]|jgi:hypothetical protein|nr:hypothetical protein [Xanthobacteraceae bacterium]
MSKHEFIPDTPSPSGEAAIPLTSELSATPKMALAGVDAAKADMAKTDTAKAEAVSASLPEAAPAETATRTVGHKIDLAGVDAPGIAPDMPDMDELKPSFYKEAAERDDALQDSADETPHVSRFTLLAAALALAAALGAMIGALAAYGLARPANTAVAAGRTGLEEVQALKENVVQTRVELAALKLSIDSANRNAAAQFTRISERIDRVERAQAEPAAKLAKAVDALERLSRGEAAPKDVTGSVLPPPAAVNQATKPGAIDGWVVRDVHRGTALIEGRMGLIEVDQGDVVPGLGRVDAIRRQDGRWVVVTSKGLIMPPR